jgi:hypothetical protein
LRSLIDKGKAVAQWLARVHDTRVGNWFLENQLGPRGGRFEGERDCEQDTPLDGFACHLDSFPGRSVPVLMAVNGRFVPGRFTRFFGNRQSESDGIAFYLGAE